MFGSGKKKQARSVEEFLKGQDAGTPSATETFLVNGSAADDETGGPKTKGLTDNEAGAPKTKRWFVAPAVVAGGLLVLLFVAFVKINGLKSDIARLRLESNRETVETLKAQVAALDSKVRKSDEEAAQLKTNIALLGKDLGEMKLMNMRRQKAETAAKKPAVDNKKKPVRPARRAT
jgi:hypothetical protein